MTRAVHWTSTMNVFRKIVEDARALAWITAADGYCVYYSPAWYAFTGTEPGTNLGLSWLELIHPDDRTRTRRAFFEANDGEKEYAVSYRLGKADGSTQVVWGHGLPQFGADGRFSGYLGMTQTMENYASLTDEASKVWPAELGAPLSAREKAVLTLISQGYSNEDVALELGIGLRTVEAHVRNGTFKLGATNRVHAVAKAIKLNAI